MEQATFIMTCVSVTNACQEQCAAKPFFFFSSVMPSFITLTTFYTTSQASGLINLVKSIIYQFGYFIPLFTVKVDLSINLQRNYLLQQTVSFFKKALLFMQTLH